MSASTPEVFTNMPTETTNLFSHLPSVWTQKFSKLLTMLPQELSSLFSSHLNSFFIAVRTTLPSALTSPPPEDLSLSPDFPALFTRFTDTLTIILGTMFTTVTLTTPSRRLGDRCSAFLTKLHAALYFNVPSDLFDLFDRLFEVMDDPPAAQPYSALTSFPSELFSPLSNTLPSDLHPLSIELNDLLEELVCDMLWTFIPILQELNEELRGDENDRPAAPVSHLEGLPAQYVYQASEDAKTEPEICSVCLDEMKDGDNARRLGCSHFFHVKCIDCWLKTKKNCPLCRVPIDATHD